MKTKLTKTDYAEITSIAHRLWQANIHDKYHSDNADMFNAVCWIQATIDYTKARNITIKDGEVYENKIKEP